MKRGKSYSASAGVRRRKLPLILAIAIPLVILGGLFAYWSLRSDEKAPAAQQTTTEEPTKTSEFSSAEGRYLFHGTIAWDRALERDSGSNYGHLFQKLNTFNKEKYDSWIADLECPVTDTLVPYQRQVDSLIFNCPPQFIPEASKWFDIVNLANNHTSDLGWDNFLETQQRLEEGGISVYGSPDMTDDENRCEVMAMPVRLQKSDGEQDATIPVAFCAYHAVSRSPYPEEIKEITEYSKVMPTLAFLHMGVEYTTTNTPQQQAAAHAMIDAGADMVIGNHPHWVQNTEVYKDKLIAYSTGNLIYDQLTYEEQRSASFDIKMSIPYDDNIAKWIAYGTKCEAAKLNDSCFADMPSDLAAFNATYKYDMVAGDERPPQRWVVRKAGDELQRDTEERTNWLQTLQQLGQPERFYND